MQPISNRICPASDAAIQQAASFLKQGDLIAFPTETVYGLGGNAFDDEAINLIYHTKSRPRHNPLIIHIAAIEMAEDLAKIPPHAKALMRRYWAGPLTLILEAKTPSPLASHLITSHPHNDKNTIALRLPAHPIAQKLIAQCGFPLAAPSANISGKLSPTRPEHVMQAFAQSDQPRMILQGGDDICQQGIESTIIDASGLALKILRYGSFIPDRELAVLRTDNASETADILLAPGMLASHYAPASPLRLNAQSAKQGELMLGFGMIDGTLNLSPSGNLREAAYHFYDYFHQLDQRNPLQIAVAPIPMQGIGIALNDRLRRAAHPQSCAKNG